MGLDRRDLLKCLGGGAAGFLGSTAAAGVAASARESRTEGSFWNRGFAPLRAEGALRAVTPTTATYDTTTYVQVDPAKCRNCDACERYCPTGILRDAPGGGANTVAKPDGCMNCGQCLTHCSKNAIYENANFNAPIQAALKDPNVVTVAILAPAVRYGIMEAFGGDGVEAMGRTVAALKKLGFDYVWDNQFGADVTIWEEASELLQRVNKQVAKPLPQFTSCCPGWVKYVESFYPTLIPNLSTCKSPFGMMGALSKTYGAQKNKIEPFKMFTVAITPCIAKKFEVLRPEMNDSGYRDLDAVLDSRELIAMIKAAGIAFATLPETQPDPFMGASSGGGTLFAVTGGVTEAALRYAWPYLSDEDQEVIDFQPVRGLTGVRSAEIPTIHGPLKVALVAGLANAKPICDAVKAGTSPYHFIEVMSCMGGCVNGGGQPIPKSRAAVNVARNAIATLKSRLTSLV